MSAASPPPFLYASAAAERTADLCRHGWRASPVRPVALATRQVTETELGEPGTRRLLLVRVADMVRDGYAFRAAGPDRWHVDQVPTTYLHGV